MANANKPVSNKCAMCGGKFKKSELYTTSTGLLCKTCYSIRKTQLNEGWEQVKTGISTRDLRTLQMRRPDGKKYTLETDVTDAEIHKRYPQHEILSSKFVSKGVEQRDSFADNAQSVEI